MDDILTTDSLDYSDPSTGAEPSGDWGSSLTSLASGVGSLAGGLGQLKAVFTPQGQVQQVPQTAGPVAASPAVPSKVQPVKAGLIGRLSAKLGAPAWAVITGIAVIGLATLGIGVWILKKIF